MPLHCIQAVEQFAVDFRRVTQAWVAAGHHTDEEVREWRAVIRHDMETDAGANPAIDDRPREVRIRAWCRTFRDLAKTECGVSDARNSGKASSGEGGRHGQAG